MIMNSDVFKLYALVIIIVFYASYFIKMFLQKKNGITTNQMSKGSKPQSTLYVERVLIVSTSLIVLIEVISIILFQYKYNKVVVYLGLTLSTLGVIIFISALITMKNSWRAGVNFDENTEFIKSGVYRISRNPAFLGFDFLYIGILISFFNYILLATTLFCIIAFHLQIIEEEKYLEIKFGNVYLDYKRKTARYFIF